MSNTTTEKDPAVIYLPDVRLSFPQLFVAKGMPGSDKLKYSATLLLDKKKHKPLIEKIEKLIERTALDFFKKAVKLKHRCLHDGNEKEETDGYGDEVMFLVAKSDQRPVVIDGKKNPLAADDGVIYGGCYVNASVRLFAFDHPTGGKGVSASLRAVQFLRGGESFGAGPVDVDSDGFQEVTDGGDDVNKY